MNELKIVEHQNQRVLTTQQLAESYGTTTDVITRNFNRNKERYQEGKHFYSLEGEEKTTFLNQGQFDRGLKNAKTIYLWTERGAFLHAKSLNTDKAWEVYDSLVEHYFKSTQAKPNLIPHNYKEAIQHLLTQIEENEKLQLENKIKDQQIAELKPRADYTDKILRNKGLVITTAIAKDYGMSACEFNKILYNLKIQFKQSGQWFLYRKYQDKGYTSSETVNFKHSDGRDDVKMNTKWTQKGRLFLYNILKEHGILPLIERDIAIA